MWDSIADVLEEDITTLLDIGKKNTFNNQTNQGNGYVETGKTVAMWRRIA